MKKPLLITLAFLLSVTAFAQVLTPDEALSNALAKLSKGVAADCRSRVARIPKSDITLSCIEKSNSQTPLVYAYNLSGGGFILAGADRRSNSLLGYTDTGSYEEIKKNTAFQGWLANCTGALEWLSKQNTADETEADIADEQTLDTFVSPILGDIKWDQNAPYNLYCPERTNDAGDSKTIAPTGCVATAMAQVMGHYQWPLYGEGSHTNATDLSQTYDFSQLKFDWDQIKPTYKSDAAGDSAFAIAQLMAEVGCAVDMSYGFDESGSSPYKILYALTHFFRYDKSARLERRKYCSTTEWNTILRGEFDAGRPVLMGAFSNDGGHAFVIDGYDINGLYHINWGWGGLSNGYYDINYLNPDQQGTGGGEGNYDIDQEIVLNIRVDSLGTSVASPQLRICDPIQYDPGNKEEFFFTYSNDGSGDFTGEIGFILVDPYNNNKVLDISSKSFKDDPVTLYDNVHPLFYHIPDDIPLKVGYIIQPYCRLTPDGTIDSIRCPLTGEKYLESYYDNATGTISWGYNYTEDLPSLTCSDVNVLRSYVGFIPKFQVTITNSATSKVEYNETITIVVSQTNDGTKADYCSGKTQCFLSPGESKTIEINCDQNAEDSPSLTYKNLNSGKYSYTIYLKRGDELCLLKDTVFTDIMIEEDPGDLVYSDFDIDKTVVNQGDMFKASFNVTNYGGFACGDYYFAIYKVDDENNKVGYFYAPHLDLPGHGEVTEVTLQGVVQLEPGDYVGYFQDHVTGDDIFDPGFCFTVQKAATDIETVQQERQQTAVYDIFGRRVKDTAKAGIYIINGKKVKK